MTKLKIAQAAVSAARMVRDLTSSSDAGPSLYDVLRQQTEMIATLSRQIAQVEDHLVMIREDLDELKELILTAPEETWAAFADEGGRAALLDFRSRLSTYRQELDVALAQGLAPHQAANVARDRLVAEGLFQKTLENLEDAANNIVVMPRSDIILVLAMLLTAEAQMRIIAGPDTVVGSTDFLSRLREVYRPAIEGFLRLDGGEIRADLARLAKLRDAELEKQFGDAAPHVGDHMIWMVDRAQAIRTGTDIPEPPNGADFDDLRRWRRPRPDCSCFGNSEAVFKEGITRREQRISALDGQHRLKPLWDGYFLHGGITTHRGVATKLTPEIRLRHTDSDGTFLPIGLAAYREGFVPDGAGDSFLDQIHADLRKIDWIGEFLLPLKFERLSGERLRASFLIHDGVQRTYLVVDPDDIMPWSGFSGRNEFDATIAGFQRELRAGRMPHCSDPDYSARRVYQGDDPVFREQDGGTGCLALDTEEKDAAVWLQETGLAVLSLALTEVTLRESLAYIDELEGILADDGN